MIGFLCNECGKSFEDEIGFVLHETRTHDNRTFPCEKCSETLVGYSKYNNHMRKHKSVEAKAKAPRKCDSCPYETTNPSNLSRHVTLVHKEKQKRKNNPKECNDCGKVFSQKYALDKHAKIHQKNEFQGTCKDCDSNFSTIDDASRELSSFLTTIYFSPKSEL